MSKVEILAHCVFEYDTAALNRDVGGFLRIAARRRLSFQAQNTQVRLPTSQRQAEQGILGASDALDEESDEMTDIRLTGVPSTEAAEEKKKT